MLNNKYIHFWIPNIFSLKGGIQVYLESLLKALASPNAGTNYEVFLKSDMGSSSDCNNFPNTRFHFLGNWPGPLANLAFAAQILAYAIWHRPKLIIAGHINFIPVAYWLKRLTGIPYWTIAYGIEAWEINRPVLQKALHQADRILAISTYTRDRLLKEQNLDPAKISLLPCTFEPNRFKIAPKPDYLLQKYNLKPQQPIILTVARLPTLERYKGYDQIINALPQIRQAIPNVHYIIVGKGHDRPRIEKLIAELELQDCVTLAGFVPDEQLSDYYNLCDVFAMPSKKEGFGIVYLEALASGKPTLGGNQDGAIDALSHGELGALINPDDLKEIAQTLIQILQKAYPHPIMYHPEIIRQKVIQIYGFERFQQTITEYLDKFFTSEKIQRR